MRIATLRDPVSVADPEMEGVRHTITPGEKYDDDDIVVKAAPWAFQDVSEWASNVEDGTANPGRKRSTRRNTETAAKE